MLKLVNGDAEKYIPKHSLSDSADDIATVKANGDSNVYGDDVRLEKTSEDTSKNYFDAPMPEADASKLDLDDLRKEAEDVFSQKLSAEEAGNTALAEQLSQQIVLPEQIAELKSEKILII